MQTLSAQIGLRPDEFWRLTVAEFRLMVAGYRQSLEAQQELLAWHAANIMNMWSKKTITPQKLLGNRDIVRQAQKERKQKQGAAE